MTIFAGIRVLDREEKQKQKERERERERNGIENFSFLVIGRIFSSIESKTSHSFNITNLHRYNRWKIDSRRNPIANKEERDGLTIGLERKTKKKERED